MSTSHRVRPTVAAIRTFEQVHQALQDAKGLISVALADLGKMTKDVWTYERLEAMLEDPAYIEWKRAARSIFLDHAEVDSIRRIANTEGLTDQARAGIMIALLKGEHQKGLNLALKGRAKDAAKTDDGDEEFSPTAQALFGDEE